MKHVKIIGLALLAMFAISAVGATAAMAEEAPYFGVESKRLASGESQEFTTTKKSATYELKAGTITIVCSNQTTKAGAKLIGSNAGEPGTNSETVEFTGCTITGNGTPCNVKEPIVTKPLTTTLAYESKKKSVITIFEPASGAEFVKLEFTGTGCSVLSTVVEGSVAAESLSDAHVLVELGKTPVLETLGIVNFPATRIASAWVIKGGVGSSKTIKLNAFGVTSTLVGETLIGLVSGKKWCILS